MKRFLNLVFAMLAVVLAAVAVSNVTGLSLTVAAVLMLALSFVPSGAQGGALFAGLNKEIWLPEIMEGFFPDDSFLKRSRDLSAFVENDKINIAEAGIMPDVLINNTTYPIPVQEREDIPHSIELDYYDTKNIVVRNAEAVELSYDKRQSVIEGFRRQLREAFAKKAIHAYAPDQNGEFTPVLASTGEDDGTGRKKLTFDDVLKLFELFNMVDIPDDRVLVLHPKHQADLMAEDKKLFKEVMRDGELYGFRLFRFSKMPVYDKSTGTKKAYGAAAGDNDTIASVAWSESEVMRALGTFDLFLKERDPEHRGDIMARHCVAHA